MTEFQVEIKGAKELISAMRKYPRIAEPILQRAIDATSAIFGKHTLRNNPVPWRSGNLLQSFRFTRGRLQAKWFPTASYAGGVELGTRPHMIYPVKGSALKWQSGGSAGYVTAASGRRYYRKQEGSTRFAKQVRHPGTKPQPFMQRIVERSQADIDRVFLQAVQLITERLKTA